MKILTSRLTNSGGILIRYAFVGVTLNSAVLGLFLVLNLFLQVDGLFALLLASSLVFPLSYLSNKLWVFRYEKAEKSTLRYFAMGYSVSLGAQLLIFWFARNLVPGHSDSKIGSAVILAIAISFFLFQRFAVFRQHDS